MSGKAETASDEDMWHMQCGGDGCRACKWTGLEQRTFAVRAKKKEAPAEAPPVKPDYSVN
jgi:hypothetical protein